MIKQHCDYNFPSCPKPDVIFPTYGSIFMVPHRYLLYKVRSRCFEIVSRYIFFEENTLDEDGGAAGNSGAVRSS